MERTCVMEDPTGETGHQGMKKGGSEEEVCSIRREGGRKESALAGQ